MNTKSSWSQRCRKLAGFSIVEVTCGMAIVGTVVSALMSGFTSGLFSMQLARENLRATQILLERMETIRLYSWEEINTPNFITSSFTADYDPLSVNKGVTYYGTISITNAPVSSSYSNNMRLVTVNLNWKTGNLERHREFSSYISRSGIQNYIY